MPTTTTLTRGEGHNPDSPRPVRALLMLGKAATIQISRRGSAVDLHGQRPQFQERSDAKEALAGWHQGKLDVRPPQRWGINE